MGSICLEKLVFEGFKYRTTRMIEAVEIYTVDRVSAKIKMDKPNHFSIGPFLCPELDSNQHILANAAT
jgi:hypothetical protein